MCGRGSVDLFHGYEALLFQGQGPDSVVVLSILSLIKKNSHDSQHPAQGLCFYWLPGPCPGLNSSYKLLLILIVGLLQNSAGTTCAFEVLFHGS